MEIPTIPAGYRLVKDGGELHHTVSFRTTSRGFSQLTDLAETFDGRLATAIRWVLDQPVVQELVEARIRVFSPSLAAEEEAGGL
jgi:hypothetical protein